MTDRSLPWHLRRQPQGDKSLSPGFKNHSCNDPFMQDETHAWRKLPLLLAAIIPIHVVTLSPADLTFQATA